MPALPRYASCTVSYQVSHDWHTRMGRIPDGSEGRRWRRTRGRGRTMRVTPFEIGVLIIIVVIFGGGAVSAVRRRHRRPR